MNKKLIYSFNTLAVAASLVTFSSCQKDEFTAKDAWELEKEQKEHQAELNKAASTQELNNLKDLMKYAHTLDSLKAANAGGLVYYSVAVVPGGSSAFGQGRYSEVGVNNVKVTIEQYGQKAEATTANGLAVFSKPLRSGEVTVTIDGGAAGYTSASYVANLTPDGGVPNGGTVHVGNIIPVFETDPAAAGNDAKMAKISGNAYAELDITYGNNEEESAPAGTAFTAVIDVNNDFMNTYIREANDEGGIHGEFGTATKSGFVQRIAYQSASTQAKVAADGSYSMMVAATASGLPIKMNYSDFAADRTYFESDIYDDNYWEVTSERHLYGPNVTPDPIKLRGKINPLAGFVVDFGGGADVAASYVEGDEVVGIEVTSGGAYLHTPEVVLSGNATAEVSEMESITDGGKLKKVASIKVTDAGSGYTSAPSVSFTRQELDVTGNGFIMSTKSELAQARVIDSGFGFGPGYPAKARFDQTGEWTGLDPVLNLPSDITGVAVDFIYDFEANAGDDLGIVQNIKVTAGGSGWTADDSSKTGLDYLNADPFSYLVNAIVIPTADSNGDLIFKQVDGKLEFNLEYGNDNADDFGSFGDLTGSDNNTLYIQDFITPDQFVGDVAGIISGFSQGSGYVFVPSISIQNGGGSGAQAQAILDGEGKLIELELTNAGSGFADAGLSQITVKANDPGADQTLDAQFYLSGGGSIDAYDIDVEEDSRLAGSYVSPNPDVIDGYVIGDNNVEDLDPENNSYYAMFEHTDGTAVTADGWYAIGLPELRGNQVIGMEIIDKGFGYDASKEVSWKLYEVGAADAKAKAILEDDALIFTINSGGSYAITPEIILTASNYSYKELAGENDPANFDVKIESGVITEIEYNGSLSQLDDATDLGVIVTLERQEADFNQAAAELDDEGIWFTGSGAGSITSVVYPDAYSTHKEAWAAVAAEAGTENTYYIAPFIDIDGNATAEFTLNKRNGEIVDLTITSGGSGYLATETNDLHYSPEGEPFRVLGGPSAWKAYSGIQYVRDVHYGTGKELE